MLQEAQAAMARAQTLEAELAEERIGIDKGPIKAVFNGVGELIGISIDKTVVDPDDIEALEDLIVSTVRSGFAEATERRNAKVQQIVPKIPGLT